jgi:heat shock protein HtpX
VPSRIDKLVKFAGGRDPGPLAPPEEAEDEPEQAEVTDQSPPPLPHHGPWGDAEPAGTPEGPARDPLQGPWGRHA